MKWFAGIVIWAALVVTPYASANSDLAFNRLGFLPDASKIVVVPAVEAGAFYLVDETNRQEMLRGPLTQAQSAPPAKGRFKIADFTAFNKPGTYRVRVPGLKDSAPFTIGEGVYDELFHSLANAFYLHRAGAPLLPEYAGTLARSSIFADLMVATDHAKPNKGWAAYPKGWLTGSDYGKNVIANSLALAGIFHAYQDSPEAFKKIRLSIPENTPQFADILLEAAWSLDWLLAMQDSDGGVFHAIATRGETNAQILDKNGRALMPKSTAATLTFAAITARAAMLANKKHLPADGERLSKAALLAWQYARKNPQQVYAPPAGFPEKPYATVNDDLKDEWLWAAAELFALTGKKEFSNAIQLPANLRDGVEQNLDMWGLFALLENAKTPANLKQNATQLLKRHAATLLQMQWQSGLLVPLAEKDFAGDVHAIALARAVLLLKAQQYFGGGDYEAAARGVLDYLLGRNVDGDVFVPHQKAPVSINKRENDAAWQVTNDDLAKWLFSISVLK